MAQGKNTTTIIIAIVLFIIVIIGLIILTHLWNKEEEQEEELVSKGRHYAVDGSDAVKMEADHPFAPIVNKNKKEMEDHPFAPVSKERKEEDKFSIHSNNTSRKSSNDDYLKFYSEEKLESNIQNANKISPYVIGNQMKMVPNNYNGRTPNYNHNSFDERNLHGINGLQYNSDSSNSNVIPLIPQTPTYPIPITSQLPLNSQIPVATQINIASQLPLGTQIPNYAQIPIAPQLPITSQIPISAQIPITAQTSKSSYIPTEEYNESSESHSLNRSSSLTRKRSYTENSISARNNKSHQRSNSQSSIKTEDESLKQSRDHSTSKSFEDGLSVKSNDDDTSKKSKKPRRPQGRVGPPVVSKAPTRGILKTKSKYAKYDKSNNESDTKRVSSDNTATTSNGNINQEYSDDEPQKNNKYHKYR